MFITEALHPYTVFKEHGFDVDFVSETGTYDPDWLSQQGDWLKGEDKDAWEGKTGEFRAKLDGLAKAGDVDPDKVREVRWGTRTHMHACMAQTLHLLDIVPAHPPSHLQLAETQ